MSDDLDEVNAQRAANLKRSLEAAKTRRQHAWNLLKRTRNPEYVALRYGYPLSTMTEALAKLNEAETNVEKTVTLRSGRVVENPAVGPQHTTPKRLADVLPEALCGPPPPPRNKEG